MIKSIDPLSADETPAIRTAIQASFEASWQLDLVCGNQCGKSACLDITFKKEF